MVYRNFKSQFEGATVVDKVIGISFFLHEKGEGHYFSVHSGYHNEFFKRGYEHFYLSRVDKESNLDWIKPSLTYQPIELYGLKSKSEILSTFNTIHKSIDSRKFFIYIFEGNINYWLIIALVCRVTGSTGHVNLMRSDLMIDNINRQNKIFKNWIKFCKLISGKQVTVSVLTQNMADKLYQFSGYKFKVIPTFSGFKKSTNLNHPKMSETSDSKILVAAPYPSDLEKLNEVFNLRPDLVDRVKVTTWVDDYENYMSFTCEITNKHLSDDEYGKLILSSKYVVLLYTNIFHTYGSSSKGYDAALFNKSICVTQSSSAAQQIRGIANYFLFNHNVISEVIQAIENPNFFVEINKILPPSEVDAVDFLIQQRRRNGGFLSRFTGLLILKFIKSDTKLARIFLGKTLK